MAELPSAETSVQATAGRVATGTDLVTLICPVATNADATPRRFGSAADCYAFHGYCEGVEYAGFHVQETRKPFLFVGIPIATAGAIEREDTTGNTDSSTSTLAAGGSGVLGEHDGVLRVKSGGTIGTDQIVLDYSLDGGRTFKTFRLGTASTFAIPFVGVTASFGAGDLTTGETIHTWHGSSPRGDSDGVAAARAALAASQRDWRTALLFGDLQSLTEANAVRDEINAYETENQRFKVIRCSVYDQAPATRLNDSSAAMQGAPNLTFDLATETITRDAGSWIDDGVRAGDVIVVDGSSSNDGTYTVVSPVTNAVLTVATGLADEVDAVGVGVTRHTGLTFTNTGETLARSRGSWISEGFRDGDSITIAGTSGGTNNGTFAIVTATALELTLEAGAVDADEVASAGVVTVVGAGAQSKAAWMAEIDDEFGPLDGQPRISLSAGRARKTHPFSGWYMRRPWMWAASLREYALRDLHVATWRKSDGATGWDLNDADGNLVEWDDRVDGEAGSAARFTTARTWANGPEGAFVALDLTRAGDSSLQQYVSKANVVNLACQTVQLNTENAAIGVDLVLNADGTATTESLAAIESVVNKALEKALLQNLRGEGQRASRAVWTADPATDMSVAAPELVGSLDLLLNGTIVKVRTTVRVQTGS